MRVELICCHYECFTQNCYLLLILSSCDSDSNLIIIVLNLQIWLNNVQNGSKSSKIVENIQSVSKCLKSVLDGEKFSQTIQSIQSYRKLFKDFCHTRAPSWILS